MLCHCTALFVFVVVNLALFISRSRSERRLIYLTLAVGRRVDDLGIAVGAPGR